MSWLVLSPNAVDLHVGTSGYAYKEWRGGFYPTELKEPEFLGHYATQLTTVEINNTFYRMPNADAVEAWRSRVPEHFRFAVKATRRITHISRLANTEQPVDFLVERMNGFGDRLGCVLFQLPPTFRCNLKRLERFLEHLDGRLPAAFEFRHPSWLEAEVFEVLRSHPAALCVGDPEDEANTPPCVATAPFVYARMRKEAYPDAEMLQWLDRLQAMSCERAFVYFKHETLAPQLATRMVELWQKRG